MATHVHDHRANTHRDHDHRAGPPDDGHPLDLFARRREVDTASPPWRALLRWQRRTLVLLICVYTGFYFCRTDLSVALPTLLHATHLSKTSFGSVISAGYAVYAMGKIVNGMLIDRIGGRFILLTCLVGSILCTVLFACVSDQSGSIAVFTTLWSFNRLFQSGGWPALTTIVRDWFPPSQHGKIMGLAALSYSLGDAIIRLVLGFLVSHGFSWQGIFLTSALAASVLVAPSFVYLFSSPVLLGLPPVSKGMDDVNIPLTNTSTSLACPPSPSPSSPVSMHRTRTPPLAVNTTTTVRPRHVPLSVPRQPTTNTRWCGRWSSFILANPKYIVLLIQSPLFTWMREIFNSWAVVYLHEAYSLGEGMASILTVVFPLLAALSSVGGGFFVDTVPRAHRGFVYTVLVLATAVVMGVLAIVAVQHDTHHHSHHHQHGPSSSVSSSDTLHGHNTPSSPDHVASSPGTVGVVVLLMGLASLFSTAPTSWAEGVFPLELASRDNAGIVVASVHAVGYIGAILAGSFAGSVVEAAGWGRLYTMMSSAATLNAALAAVYWWYDVADLQRHDRDQHHGHHHPRLPHSPMLSSPCSSSSSPVATPSPSSSPPLSPTAEASPHPLIPYGSSTQRNSGLRHNRDSASRSPRGLYSKVSVTYH